MINDQRQYNGAKTVFGTTDAGRSKHIQAKTINLDTDLKTFTKINKVDHRPKQKNAKL